MDIPMPEQLHGTLLWIRQLPEMFLAMMRLFSPVSDGIKTQ